MERHRLIRETIKEHNGTSYVISLHESMDCQKKEKEKDSSEDEEVDEDEETTGNEEHVPAKNGSSKRKLCRSKVVRSFDRPQKYVGRRNNSCDNVVGASSEDNSTVHNEVKKCNSEPYGTRHGGQIPQKFDSTDGSRRKAVRVKEKPSGEVYQRRTTSFDEVLGEDDDEEYESTANISVVSVMRNKDMIKIRSASLGNPQDIHIENSERRCELSRSRSDPPPPTPHRHIEVNETDFSDFVLRRQFSDDKVVRRKAVRMNSKPSGATYQQRTSAFDEVLREEDEDSDIYESIENISVVSVLRNKNKHESFNISQNLYTDKTDKQIEFCRCGSETSYLSPTKQIQQNIANRYGETHNEHGDSMTETFLLCEKCGKMCISDEKSREGSISSTKSSGSFSSGISYGRSSVLSTTSSGDIEHASLKNNQEDEFDSGCDNDEYLRPVDLLCEGPSCDEPLYYVLERTDEAKSLANDKDQNLDEHFQKQLERVENYDAGIEEEPIYESVGTYNDSTYQTLASLHADECDGNS